ncbi:NAD(P)-dependent oxidoreductase [Streptomyces sp. NPDC092296]|uniref:NAD(P)-dependent oxidoreductase n=1 Tax=Streptomyces sp. NPDC092296 TaxID=3366012 RepID=UPI003820FBF2
MKVLLFGATGHIGSAIAAELLSRGHQVTGVTRSGSNGDDAGFPLVAGDVSNAAQVAELAAGHDLVASAVGPRLGVDDDREILIGATNGLIEGLRKSGVKRLVVLGGAGSLETAPGVRVIDSPHFPEMWKANAHAQIEALGIYREVQDLDWTFISPAQMIEPGERTGSYRVGGEQLLVDAEGKSRISIADYAIAFVDEIERGASIRTRIAVAY